MADTINTSFLTDLDYVTLDAPNFSTPTFLSDGISVASAFASDSLTAATMFLNNLANLASQIGTIAPITTTVGTVDMVITDLQMPAAPAVPNNITFENLPAPAEPVLGEVISPDIPPVPEFTATKPALSYPSAPSPLSANLPSSPTLFDVTLPDAPAVVMPDEPLLVGINLPAAPVISLPSFDYTPPVVPDTPNIAALSFTEPDYTSTLLDALRAQLESWVNGADTGLGEDVESALFERGRSRETASSLREQQEIRRAYAASGFPAPPGAMMIAVQDAVRASINKVSDINRDILVKVADLQQQNRHFALQHGVALEGALLERANQIANRALEAAKVTITSAISLYQIIVARFQAELEMFRTEAVVFETRLRAALSVLDLYRAQLEAAKVAGELNMQLVEVYRTKVGAVTALIENYKAQLAGAEVISNINRSLIGAYSEEVNAYSAQVNAKAKEYDGYATQVQAEVSKISAYTAEADAYRSQMGGYTSMVNAMLGAKEMEFKIEQQNPLAIYNARVDAFKTAVMAEAERVKAITSVYDSSVRSFAAEADAEARRYVANIEEFKTKSDVAVETARVGVQGALADATRLTSIITLASDISKTGGTITAQLAASAMSMLNFSQHIGGSWSLNGSVSSSVSTNYNHSYTE
jgi:hypothetical protein